MLPIATHSDFLYRGISRDFKLHYKGWELEESVYTFELQLKKESTSPSKKHEVNDRFWEKDRD